MYKDRAEAGKVLLGHLKKYKKDDVIVIAIPRGGVVVASEIARGLKAPLSLIVTRKISAPFNSEFAIGGLIDRDNYILDEKMVAHFSVPMDYIRREIETKAKEAEEYRDKYLGDKIWPGLTQKVVILVDDGLATGYTALAAAMALSKEQPKKLTLAVPVAPKETLVLFSGWVDEIVCPLTPDPFYGVGQFYEDFSQTTDQEVALALKG